MKVLRLTKLKQIEWGQDGAVTKSGVLPLTTLFVRKFRFSLCTSHKELIWCTNDQHAHINTFRKSWSFTLCEKCQIRSFFWSVSSHIKTEYGEILRFSPSSVWMWENTDQRKIRIWTLFTRFYLRVLFFLLVSLRTAYFY